MEREDAAEAAAAAARILSEVEEDVDREATVTMGTLGVVNYYIKDYLERSQLEKTLSIFLRECRELDLPVGDQGAGGGGERHGDDLVTEATCEHALEMFDCAYEDAFFKIWDDPDSLPHALDTTSYVKLNFRLRLYFCCRKMAEGLAPVTDSLQSIRDFFDREGAGLSGEQEFMHYFALPFVAEPMKHPSFRGLFQPNNWVRVREDLTAYLQDLRLSGRYSSELVHMVLAYAQLPGRHKSDQQRLLYQQIVAKERDAQKVRRRYAQLAAGHQQLRRDYQKLIAVTKELTSGLEAVAMATSAPSSAVAGGREVTSTEALQTIQWDRILGNCSRIYPELFPPVTPSARSRKELPRMNKEIFQNSKWSNALMPSSTTPPLRLSPSGPSSGNGSFSESYTSVIRENRLDFFKIKSDFMEEEISRRKLLLLQALRWLLTQSSNSERYAVLDAYLRQDLLGLTSAAVSKSLQKERNLGERILASILPSEASVWRPDDEVMGKVEGNSKMVFAMAQQSCTARLINAMASIKKGRDYLGSYDRLVETLIDCLMVLGTKKQRHTVDMILATLQKLSLKGAIRKKMIERGIIEFLVRYLQQEDSVITSKASYGLEYSTALFMNLCLHRSGKERCLPFAREVLHIFAGLLTTCSRQVLPYVNGTLYSLLRHPFLATQARQMGLDRRLEDALHKSNGGDPQNRKQLTHILQQLGSGSSSRGQQQRVPSTEDDTSHNSSSTTTTISDEEDDESVDEDIEIEDEIDADDPVVAEPGEISGIEFLEMHYTVDPETALTESESSQGTTNTATKSDDLKEILMEQSQPLSPPQPQLPQQRQEATEATQISPKSDGSSKVNCGNKSAALGQETASQLLATETCQDEGKIRDLGAHSTEPISYSSDEGVVLIMDNHVMQRGGGGGGDSGGGGGSDIRRPESIPLRLSSTDEPDQNETTSCPLDQAQPLSENQPIQKLPDSHSDQDGEVVIKPDNSESPPEQQVNLETLAEEANKGESAGARQIMTSEDVTGQANQTEQPQRGDVTKEEIIPLDQAKGGARSIQRQTSKKHQRRRAEVRVAATVTTSEESLPLLLQHEQHQASAGNQILTSTVAAGPPLPPVQQNNISRRRRSLANSQTPEALSSPPATGVQPEGDQHQHGAQSESREQNAGSALQGRTIAVLPPLQSHSGEKSLKEDAASSQTRPGSRVSRSQPTSRRAAPSRSSSAARKTLGGEKRTIAMSFPYSPLRTGNDAYEAVFAPKPRVARSPPPLTR